MPFQSDPTYREGQDLVLPGGLRNVGQEPQQVPALYSARHVHVDGAEVFVGLCCTKQAARMRSQTLTLTCFTTTSSSST